MGVCGCGHGRGGNSLRVDTLIGEGRKRCEIKNIYPICLTCAW